MRRADRLFDIIQRLRAARGPVTAATLATELEVTVRTIYRDVAALQARRVPIDGAAGIGYVFRRGFDLPPLMFDPDEVEAIVVGAQLLRRTGDAGLQAAAKRVVSKVAVVLPREAQPCLEAPVFVSGFGATASPAVDFALVRTAIRARHKLRLLYQDGAGRRTRRTIWPIAVAYYVQATLLAGWCERRRDYRHFRTDRIMSLVLLEDVFEDPDGSLAQGWRGLDRFPANPMASVDRQAQPAHRGSRRPRC